jgi:UDP-N-acetylmuramyl-tripeptide synthetase
MKKLLKKFTPKFIVSWYHMSLAILAMVIYGNPSKKLIIIGVTGTNGKSTTVNLISTILEQAGFNIGSISTIEFKIIDKVWLNDLKMTMPGRFYLQKFLKQLVEKNCQYVVIETSSEGITQYRHLGINYDMVVFTNLTPEHLESHGGFENYKKAKGKLFKHLTKKTKKKINNKLIDKTIIVNKDSQHADYFLNFPADKKITYSIKNSSDFQANNVEYSSESTEFFIQKNFFKTYLIGEYNLYNILAAIAVARSQNIDTSIIKHAIFNPRQIPGRLEFIENDKNFQILVDYAPEPESMKKLYKTLTLFNFKKIIHVLGSAGGGRDKSRRPILGEIAIKNANVIIITNEDPYDENPQAIIDQVAKGAKDYLKKLSAKDSLNDNNNLNLPRIYKILDRKEAIKKALSLASSEDLVLITGKGCEQAICVENGKKIPWDDREIIRELLKSNNQVPPKK